jgi:hypothetical protein
MIECTSADLKKIIIALLNYIIFNDVFSFGILCSIVYAVSVITTIEIYLAIHNLDK